MNKYNNFTSVEAAADAAKLVAEAAKQAIDAPQETTDAALAAFGAGIENIFQVDVLVVLLFFFH